MMAKIITFKEEDWNYLTEHINWGASNLDAKAIGIWNDAEQNKREEPK